MKKKDARKRTPAQQTLAAKLRARKDTGVDTSPHLIVIARAGTGKTTTLVEGLKLVIEQTSPLTPSPQQAAVWDAMVKSKGKARTICFVAFNKAIAEELSSRVPDGCYAMTMHSMGFKAVQRAFGKPDAQVKLNGYRVQDIISELEGRDIRWLRKHEPELLSATEKLVGLCKMNLVGCNTAGALSPEFKVMVEEYSNSWLDEINDLAARYDVDLNGNAERVAKLVSQVLERCKDVSRDGCIDFNDMIWVPVALGLNVYRYDMLLVDEAQDLNRCQQELAIKAGRRLILCGDNRQAIYGFAGADVDSMPRMQARLDGTDRGCTVLPLTVTRRCGKAIVKEACQIVPDFEAHESNGDGVVGRALLDDGQYKVTIDGPRVERAYQERVTDGDMILCRTNAPLVSECFKFIRAGRKANIRGRDIGQGLINTVQKLMKNYVAPPPVYVCNPNPDVHEIVELQRRLDDWLAGEQRKEQAKRNPNDARLIGLQDRYDCLCVFCEGQNTVEEVVARIEAVFNNGNADGIMLSSVHKAKGLEAKRVFILLPENGGMPHPMAKSEWQRDQEWNLKYVAITRAIEELVYVT